jgi:spectinomycin phosphotransferase
MRRDELTLDSDAIAVALAEHYDLTVSVMTFLPIGYDLNAAVYEVVARDGNTYFLKVRFGTVAETGLHVARALVDRGTPHVLAPLPTRSGGVWAPIAGDEGGAVVLYPFVLGESAQEVGLSADQWRVFGRTLRAIHDSGLEEVFHSSLRVEDFALPSAALVRRVLALVHESTFASLPAGWFAAFWRGHADRIDAMLERAEALGRSLQSRSRPTVLCHGDIHAANILVGDDSQIHLVDWDAPLIAPRERDLLFVIGSTIARPVEPQEEDWFFEGYGPVVVDPSALIYYRYERIVEDLGEIGKSVFLEPDRSEELRAAETELAMSFFTPGGDSDRAEIIAPRWLRSPAI